MIDLRALNLSGFGDVDARQVGGDVVIDLSGDGGGTITLDNFRLGNLDADDFLF